MKLTVRPLTPELWPALEDLFGARGACNGCWCMWGRIGAEYRKRPARRNKADFRDIVKRGPPPGLLAFDGDTAVGWCQVTPRDAVPWLDRTWRLKRVDDLPVWSLSCLYVRIGYRRKGVTAALIAAAVKAAKREGARARSVSAGCRCDPELVQHRVRVDVRAPGVPGGDAPHAATPDHAARPEVTGSVRRVLAATRPPVANRIRMKAMTRRLVLTLLASAAIACGGSDDSPTGPTEVTGSAAFSSRDLIEGTGAQATSGQQITVRYSGWLYSDSATENKGRLFDSTSLPGKPPTYSFAVGTGAVIRGWDLGVPGMRIGGRRRIVTPPDVAYGAAGRPPEIPPNATLLFEVELVSIP